MGLFAKAETLIGTAGRFVGQQVNELSHKTEGWGAKADVFVADKLSQVAEAVKKGSEAPASEDKPAETTPVATDTTAPKE